MTEILPPPAYDASAVLIHDVGNYMQIAMSAMRLMSRHDGIANSPKLVAMVAQAEESLGRAGALISAFAIQEPIDEEIRLDECLNEVSTLLRYATGPRVRLRMHVGRLPKLRLDRLGLQNVLVNLAINARDAMPEGGVLAISALLVEGPEASEVEVVVTDTGVGMGAETLAHAFEPRFTTKPNGGGLGLAGARRFIEAAGGRISIKSELGKGTAVTMRVPVAS